jgi:hypothetical protein
MAETAMYKMEGLDASDRRLVQMAMISNMTSTEIENVEGLLSIEVRVIVQRAWMYGMNSGRSRRKILNVTV